MEVSRMRRSIRGGIDFSSYNSNSLPASTDCFPAPDSLTIPSSVISGHELSVSVGDRVFVGTIIADDRIFPVLSPMSGSVTAFGSDGSITLSNDHKNELSPECLPYDVETGKLASGITADEFINRIRRFAIPDRTHSPLADKVARAHTKSYRLAIVAFDSQPYISLNRQIAYLFPEKIIGAAKLTMYALGIAEGSIVTAEGDKELSERIAALTAGDDTVDTIGIHPIYPSDDDRLLYNLLIGKELGVSKSAETSGLLVISADIAVAIYDAFVSGTPYTHPFIFIGGSLAEESCIFSVPLYTKIGDLTDICSNGPDTVIENGIMNGNIRKRTDLTGPFTYSLTIVDEKKIPHTDCIGCGKCESVCPMYLIPTKLSGLRNRHPVTAFIEKLLFGNYLTHTAGICINCGCCSFVCPSGINLRQLITENAAENAKKEDKQGE